MTIRRSRSQWQQLMTAQQASGLSQKVFCQQEGISVAIFGYWKRKLKREAGVSTLAWPQADASPDWLELPLPVFAQAAAVGRSNWIWATASVCA